MFCFDTESSTLKGRLAETVSVDHILSHSFFNNRILKLKIYSFQVYTITHCIISQRIHLLSNQLPKIK
jgi:hypothetical protein